MKDANVKGKSKNFYKKFTIQAEILNLNLLTSGTSGLSKKK